jgi:4-hydroxyphenylpyruvate dioxygenase-like putative hemolysin
LQGSGIETLDISDNYYDEVFNRVPNVTEDREGIQRLQILVDKTKNIASKNLAVATPWAASSLFWNVCLNQVPIDLHSRVSTAYAILFQTLKF